MTDDEKVVQILSKVIVNTVKNMMGDYDQTVAQKLKNIKISADNILPMSIDSTKIQKGSIQMADIANLEAKIAEIVQLDVDNVKINYAQIRDLDVYMADIAYAKIGWAKVDWASIASAKIGTATVGQLFADQASIKKLDANIIWGATNITTKGIADKFYINELAVTDASIVDLTVDKLKVRGPDDPETHEPVYYRLIGDEAGVVTEAVKLNGAYLKTDSVSGNTIIDGTLNGDDKIVGGSITARSLAAHTITANEILAGTITSNEIAANTIEGNNIKAGTITTGHVTSSFGQNLDLSSNQSVTLKVQSEVARAVPEAIGYRMEIISTSDILSSEIQSTTLSARVWNGKNNITDDLNANRFQWTRVSSDAYGDAIWNNNHRGVKSITLTTVDVVYSATYSCELADEGGT